MVQSAHFVYLMWEWSKLEHLSWAKLAMFKLKTEMSEVQVRFVIKGNSILKQDYTRVKYKAFRITGLSHFLY